MLDSFVACSFYALFIHLFVICGILCVLIDYIARRHHQISKSNTAFEVQKNNQIRMSDVSSDEGGGGGSTKTDIFNRAKKPLDIQRMQLEKLMKNPVRLALFVDIRIRISQMFFLQTNTITQTTWSGLLGEGSHHSPKEKRQQVTTRFQPAHVCAKCHGLVLYLVETQRSKHGHSTWTKIAAIKGASAGAGSGEFDIYRGCRRRESIRQEYLEKKAEKVSGSEWALRALSWDTQLN